MTDTIHRTMTGDNLHIPYFATYADAAARAAGTATSGGDATNANNVGKWAKQLDTGAVYELTDDSPITWVLVADPNALLAGGTLTGAVAAGATIAGVTASTVVAAATAGAVVASVIAALVAGIVHADGAGNLSSSAIVNADVSATAAIAGSKIAPNFGAQNIQTTGTLSTGAATVTSLRASGLGAGVGHLDGSGNLTSSALVNADVSGSAAIAGSKISPDFGSQNVQTTGTLSAGAATVTSLRVTALGAGVGHYDGSGNLTSSAIVDADVSGSAAIAGSKVNPDFGAQNVTTSGTYTSTGASSFLALRTNPATAGSVRLANNSGLQTRNAANGANVRCLMLDASDILLVGDTGNASATYNCAAAGNHTFQVNSVTQLVINATTVDAQDNAITTTGTLNAGAGTLTSLTVSSLGTGIGHYNGSGALTSSLLVNADVSASAAIDGSKVSPNFGSQNIVTTGTLALGGSPASAGSIALTHGATVQGNNNAGGTNRVLLDWGSTVADTLILGGGSHNIRINAAANQLIFQTNGTTRLTVQDTTLLFASGTATMTWPSATAAVTINQAVDNTASATGKVFSVIAQDMSGTTAVTGGILRLRPGNATGGSGTRNGGSLELLWGTGATAPGNVSIGVAAGNFQSMTGGIFIANDTADPTGNPANGGFLYVAAGALKYRGSGGTVTTVGAA